MQPEAKEGWGEKKNSVWEYVFGGVEKNGKKGSSLKKTPVKKEREEWRTKRTLENIGHRGPKKALKGEGGLKPRMSLPQGGATKGNIAGWRTRTHNIKKKQRWRKRKDTGGERGT